MRVILFIILLMFVFEVGRQMGIEETFKLTYNRIKMASNLSEFLKLMSEDWNKYR